MDQTIPENNMKDWKKITAGIGTVGVLALGAPVVPVDDTYLYSYESSIEVVEDVRYVDRPDIERETVSETFDVFMQPNGKKVEVSVPMATYRGYALKDAKRPTKKSRVNVFKALKTDGAIGIAATSTSSCTNCNSLTFAHTVSGSNTLLVVGASLVDVAIGAKVVSGVTYNSVALTKVRADEYEGVDVTLNGEVWYLIAPADGSNNIVFSFTNGTDSFVGGGLTITGAKQSDQPDANVGTSAGGSTTITDDITTVADNSIIFDHVSHTEDENGLIAGAGQTKQWDVDVNTYNDRGTASVETATTAGVYTMSWSGLVNGNQGQTLSVVSFAPAADVTVPGLMEMGSGAIQTGDGTINITN